SAPLVAGTNKYLGTTPDGTAVDLPDLAGAPNAYRFTPDGRSLVYKTNAQTFELYDLTTKKHRTLAVLEKDARIQWFDITPDGTRVVFDRAPQNSDIVLIDLAKRIDPSKKK